MRKLLIIPLLLLLITTANAQSPFKGFFQPVTIETVVEQADAKGVFENMTWLFRPSVALTAIAIDVSEKPVINNALSSAGLGLSFGKFSIIDDEAYCTFSVNASLLTSIKVNDIVSTKIGGALTVDVFNKFLGFGCAYIDNKFLLLTTISYSL